MKKNENRGETWVGIRPSVMVVRKNNKKLMRKQGKRICQDAMKQQNTDKEKE